MHGSDLGSEARLDVRVSMRRALSRLGSSHHILGLADQGMVSAASFAATVMIGRWAGPAELGAYALAVSVLVSLQAAQESLVTLPYMIVRREFSSTEAPHSGSALVLGLLLSIGAASLLAATAAGLAAAGMDANAVSLAWALCAVTPFVLLREFGRRFAFAHLRVAEAAALDGVAVAVQIVALLSLASLGALSAATACLALGGASGVAGVLRLCQTKGRIIFCARDVRERLAESWPLRNSLLLYQITLQLQIYLPYWLTFALAGPAATGVLSACMSIVAFANPFVTGLSNILMPKAVKAWREGGGSALRRQTMCGGIILGILTSGFGVFAWFFAADVMALLYPGVAYQGLGATVVTLAAALVAAALGIPPANALATIERPQPLVVAGLIGAVLTAALVALLGWGSGLPGIAWGVFAGQVAGSVARWTALHSATRGGAD